MLRRYGAYRDSRVGPSIESKPTLLFKHANVQNQGHSNNTHPPTPSTKTIDWTIDHGTRTPARMTTSLGSRTQTKPGAKRTRRDATGRRCSHRCKRRSRFGHRTGHDYKRKRKTNKRPALRGPASRPNRAQKASRNNSRTQAQPAQYSFSRRATSIYRTFIDSRHQSATYQQPAGVSEMGRVLFYCT